MHIHFLQHVPFEGPGVLSQWAAMKGFRYSTTRLYSDLIFPEPKDIDMLVVMGGPMGVHDEKEYSWLAKEKKFIRSCMEKDLEIKIIGICLGSQLLADILGAEVYSGPEKEIGWFPVEWRQEALQHPLFDFLPERQLVLHWHGDTFGIPDDATILASSPVCPNQGFIYQEKVVGLQFHLEMTEGSLQQLIEHSKEELSEEGNYIQTPEEMLSRLSCFKEANKAIIEIADRLMKVDRIT